MNRAVLYLRSSKDRSDVSIDAQRRQLTDLARERNLTVVKDYADSVERADDLDRPGLRALLHDLKGAKRAWDTVIMLDTARLARQDQGFAFVFDQECQKRGVRVVYKMLPETNPIMDVVFRQVIRAWDILHSLMSKEKGLAGMAENVRQGHRAGGRAPFGYRLVHEPTGATRDGAPVMKSRLEPTPDATRIAGYLKDRAAGVPRLRARERAALDLRDTTLIGIEWNALTYAGLTVWNVHAERVKGGYIGGAKRRPRAQWIIQEGTHAALIERSEAETILSALEKARSTRAKPAERVYLLSGLLRAPDGLPWHADCGNYRLGKGRKVAAERVESAVLKALSEGLQSPAVVAELQARIRALYAGDVDDGELKQIEAAVRDLSKNIERVSALLVETTAPQALLRSIEGWENERTLLLDRKFALEERMRSAARMKEVRPADVRRLLAKLADELASRDRASLKDSLARLIEAVELDPESFACRMHYRIVPLKSGDKLASPRDYAAIPPFSVEIVVAPNRRYSKPEVTA